MYPFRMQITERTGSSDSYRYGFNGKEKDDELKGNGNNYDFGARMYDARVGRWYSTDRVANPWISSYQFAGNRPINSIDLDGLEEYASFEAYKLHNGDAALNVNMLSGEDGVWFTQDRIQRTDRWKSAMEYITKNCDTDKLVTGTIGAFYNEYPFRQVRDYYLWAQDGMDKRGFVSMWAKGASYLVDELADTFEANDTKAVSVMSGSFVPELGKLMKELNIGIANYAIGRFNSILYGSEGESVVDWYQWDKDFIYEEQIAIAAPGIYERFSGTSALTQMNNLSRREGIFSLAISKHYFPNFALFDIDLTNQPSGFGAAGRFNVPVDMLYPQKNRNEAGILNDKQQKAVEKANKGINEYYEENKIKP